MTKSPPVSAGALGLNVLLRLRSSEQVLMVRSHHVEKVGVVATETTCEAQTTPFLLLLLATHFCF